MSFINYFTVAGVFLWVALSLSVHAQAQPGQDETESQKEIANMEAMEQAVQCRIQRYPYGFDETGLKMLFVLTNPYKERNGVDYVIMTNKKNEVVYVVHGVIRHDNDVDDLEPWYGFYVVGEETEGEIEVSHQDYFSVVELINEIGDFLNCTNIRSMTVQDLDRIPFTPVREANRKKYQRFFGKLIRCHPAEKTKSTNKQLSFMETRVTEEGTLYFDGNYTTALIKMLKTKCMYMEQRRLSKEFQSLIQ